MTGKYGRVVRVTFAAEPDRKKPGPKAAFSLATMVRRRAARPVLTKACGGGEIGVGLRNCYNWETGRFGPAHS